MEWPPAVTAAPRLKRSDFRSLESARGKCRALARLGPGLSRFHSHFESHTTRAEILSVCLVHCCMLRTRDSDSLIDLRASPSLVPFRRPCPAEPPPRAAVARCIAQATCPTGE
jgi:hypothetical protein